MIHIITVSHADHHYPVIFPTEKTGAARLQFALLFQAGNFPIEKFCEANEQIRRIEASQMQDMEAIKLRWIRAGFNPLILGTASEWQVTLYHSFPANELHRPPTGRVATLKDACAAADADLSEMLAAKGKLKV